MRTLEEIDKLLEELRVEVGIHCETSKRIDNLSMVVFHLDCAEDQIDSALTVLKRAVV